MYRSISSQITTTQSSPLNLYLNNLFFTSLWTPVPKTRRPLTSLPGSVCPYIIFEICFCRLKGDACLNCGQKEQCSVVCRGVATYQPWRLQQRAASTASSLQPDVNDNELDPNFAGCSVEASTQESAVRRNRKDAMRRQAEREGFVRFPKRRRNRGPHPRRSASTVASLTSPCALRTDVDCMEADQNVAGGAEEAAEEVHVAETERAEVDIAETERVDSSFAERRYEARRRRKQWRNWIRRPKRRLLNQRQRLCDDLSAVSLSTASASRNDAKRNEAHQTFADEAEAALDE